MFEKLCEMSDISKNSIRTMIEWGPGGGANAIRFASQISDFFGIDISQPNLDECSKQLNNNYKGFHPIMIQAEHPKTSIEKIN